MRYWLIFFLLFFISVQAAAQSDSTAYKFVGLGFGTNYLKTDLSESYQKPTLSFSAFLQFAKEKRLNTALHLSFGKVVSENREVKRLDRSEYQVNSFAQTNYQTLNFELMYYLIRKSDWGIGISQGFGFMRYTVYDKFDQNLSEQLNTRIEGEDYSGFTIILPTSLTAHYSFSNNWGIQTKVSLLNTMTDYLDNISELGNPDNNDNILRIQLSVFKRIVF